MTRRGASTAVAVIGCLLVAACSDDEPADREAGATSAPTPATTSTPPPSEA